MIIDVLDSNGNSIGNTSFGGHVAFSYPINGYSLEINLPPNGYIETMRIKSVWILPLLIVLILILVKVIG